MSHPQLLGEMLRARGVSRRAFLQYASAMASMLALPPSAAGVASMTQNILSATENTRSLPHLMSSVTPGHWPTHARSVVLSMPSGYPSTDCAKMPA